MENGYDPYFKRNYLKNLIKKELKAIHKNWIILNIKISLVIVFIIILIIVLGNLIFFENPANIREDITVDLILKVIEFYFGFVVLLFFSIYIIQLFAFVFLYFDYNSTYFPLLNAFESHEVDGLRNLEIALEKFEKHHDINYHDLFWYWYFKSLHIFLSGNTLKAINILENVINFVPKKPPFLYTEFSLLLGQCYLERREFDKATDHLKKADKFIHLFDNDNVSGWLVNALIYCLNSK